MARAIKKKKKKEKKRSSSEPNVPPFGVTDRFNENFNSNLFLFFVRYSFAVDRFASTSKVFKDTRFDDKRWK